MSDAREAKIAHSHDDSSTAQRTSVRSHADKIQWSRDPNYIVIEDELYQSSSFGNQRCHNLLPLRCVPNFVPLETRRRFTNRERSIEPLLVCCLLSKGYTTDCPESHKVDFRR